MVVQHGLRGARQRVLVPGTDKGDGTVRMRTLVMATVGLPTIVLTAAVVMLVCFWLLVAVRLTAADTFDEDADLGPWGMGGVPVAVALSLLTSVAWLLSVGGTLALTALALPDLAAGLLRLAGWRA